jgi:hypothetical protein
MPSCFMRRAATVRMIPIFCWTENLLLLFTDVGRSFDGTLSSLLLLLSSEEELIVAVDNKIINVENRNPVFHRHLRFVLRSTTNHVRQVKGILSLYSTKFTPTQFTVELFSSAAVHIHKCLYMVLEYQVQYRASPLLQCARMHCTLYWSTSTTPLR